MACVNSVAVDVSEGLRNLAMGHANSNPFQRHYLGRQLCADFWGILRGQKPQQALVKQAGSISYNIDPRRPADLPPEQSALVRSHPSVQALYQKRKSVPRGSEQYVQITRDIRNLKQRLRLAKTKEFREKWTDEQAVEDIENQLKGLPVAEYEPAPCRPQGAEQKQLMKALNAPAGETLKADNQRKVDAIRAIMRYCTVQEGKTATRVAIANGAKRSPVAVKVENDAKRSPVAVKIESPYDGAARSVFVRENGPRPLRCFVCVGMAKDVPPEDPRFNDLTHEFFSSSDLCRHFKRKHLQHLGAREPFACRVCDRTILGGQMPLRRHAQLAHGIVTREKNPPGWSKSSLLRKESRSQLPTSDIKVPRSPIWVGQ